jgi:hypothetical protein
VFAAFVVLGILYESFIHPITILSGLPSAGVGALIVLMMFRTDLWIIAMIGVVMLVGSQEERHHDDRFRHSAPHCRFVSRRGDPLGLPAALPADHDERRSRQSSAHCRSRSGPAPAPNCASRPVSRWLGACWCRSC